MYTVYHSVHYRFGHYRLCHYRLLHSLTASFTVVLFAVASLYVSHFCLLQCTPLPILCIVRHSPLFSSSTSLFNSHTLMHRCDQLTLIDFVDCRFVCCHFPYCRFVHYRFAHYHFVQYRSVHCCVVHCCFVCCRFASYLSLQCTLFPTLCIVRCFLLTDFSCCHSLYFAQIRFVLCRLPPLLLLPFPAHYYSSL